MASDEAESWPRRHSRAVGRAVRRYRVDRGLQVAELADATTRLGHPIAAQVIHNLETGRRTSVPVTDLLVLAAVLNVPPVLLIAPFDPPAADTRDRVLREYALDVEALPGQHVPGHVAALAFSGEQLPTGLDGDAADRWLAAAGVLDLYRLHRDLTADLLNDDAEFNDRGPMSPEERTSVVFELGQLRARMTGRGLALPELDPDLASELERVRRPVRRYRPSVHLALRGAGQDPDTPAQEHK